MSSTFNFSLNRPDIRELEMKLDEPPVHLIQRGNALSNKEMEELEDEVKSAQLLLLKYLNILEEYCLAVNTGVIDAGVAERLYRYKLERHVVEPMPFIKRQRKTKNDTTLWCELTDTVEGWQSGKPWVRKYKYLSPSARAGRSRRLKAPAAAPTP